MCVCVCSVYFNSESNPELKATGALHRTREFQTRTTGRKFRAHNWFAVQLVQKSFTRNETRLWHNEKRFEKKR